MLIFAEDFYCALLVVYGGVKIEEKKEQSHHALFASDSHEPLEITRAFNATKESLPHNRAEERGGARGSVEPMAGMPLLAHAGGRENYQ